MPKEMALKTQNLSAVELDFKDVGMSKKVKFEINGWSYNILAEDDFADYLKYAIEEDFATNSPNSKKAILLAYIKAKYQLFEQDEEIEKILARIQ